MTELFDNEIDEQWYKEWINKDKNKSVAPRCHTTHMPMKFGKGELLGASCSSPRKGYDIYIGLCYSMIYKFQTAPWETTKKVSVVEAEFLITDGGVPKSPVKFKKMIKWICTQLQEGKKVHVGCIGGHGRTGLVVAAVKNMMDGEKDAITWVRKHYCKRAVETQIQVKFLNKHFGIKKVKGSRIDLFSSVKGAVTGRFSMNGKGSRVKAAVTHPERITCVDGKGSIWG